MAEAAPGAHAPFAALAARLDRGRPVAVQTHDYPDIDAVASAWALAALLRLRGHTVACVHRGLVRSRSLGRLLAELGIAISGEAPGPGCQLVVVDGSPANGNVTLFPGELVGVVDHHCPSAAPLAPFVDIRPELASCSSIVSGYWDEAGEALPRDLATALLAGIQSDTDFLSRRASAEDFEAYATLFRAGDWELSSRIVRTVLDLRELGLVVRALDSAVVRDGLLYALLPGPCGQEALAVLAEFVLRAEELRAAVVAERDEGGAHISVRSKSPGISAFGLVRAALEGIGTGGGHSHSAGGIVPDSSFPGDDALRNRFFAAAASLAGAAVHH
jgi:nanoRNase/pAp phosphatase (c-di-AMP/oligoRNAs hydrolase)